MGTKEVTKYNCIDPTQRRNFRGTIGVDNPTEPGNLFSKLKTCNSRCDAPANSRTKIPAAPNERTGDSAAIPTASLREGINVTYPKNTEWLTAFKNNGAPYGTGEVYTDIRLKVHEIQHERAGIKDCSQFGFARGFFNNFFGVTNSKTLTLSVIVSKDVPKVSTGESSVTVEGLSYDILNVNRAEDKSNCEALTVQGDSRKIARVVADRGEELNVSVFLRTTKSNNPATNFESKDGVDISTRVLETLLNGSLVKYADEITILADNLKYSRENGLIRHSTLPIYPLNNRLRTADHRQLSYAIVINGQTLSRFDVLQSPSIEETGGMDSIQSFAVLRTKEVLVTKPGPGASRNRTTMSKHFVAGGNLELLASPDIAKNIDKLHAACELLPKALSPFEISRKALMHIKATILRDYIKGPTSVAQLLSPKHKSTCLDEDECNKFTFLKDLHVGGAGLLVDNSQCMQQRGTEAPRLTGDLTQVAFNNLLDDADTLLEDDLLVKGKYYSRLKKIEGETKKTLISYVTRANKNIGQKCATWNDWQDNITKTKYNRRCQFLMLLRTKETVPQDVWVGIQAVGFEGKDPIPHSFEIGVNPYEYSTAKAMKARDCWEEVSHYYPEEDTETVARNTQ